MDNNKENDQEERGLDIPYEQLNQDTLRQMIQEFVTRDGSNWDETGGDLASKVEQVMRQLRSRRIKVVFDLQTQTANLVVCH